MTDKGNVTFPSVLSWHGSFVQSTHEYSIGPKGGPTIFYNEYDTSFANVIICSPYNGHGQWKSFTAGNTKNWNDDERYFSPGTSGRIKEIPKSFKQSFLLYQGKSGDGITGTLFDWGKTMQYQSSTSSKNHHYRSRSSNINGHHHPHRRVYSHGHHDNHHQDHHLRISNNNNKTTTATRAITIEEKEAQKYEKRNTNGGMNRYNDDVTLQKIGYQTDNGAMYCFCNEKNCSDVLITEISDYLHDTLNISIGYLSFQGAGTSSGRGTAAPWCIETWVTDEDGLDPDHYPMDVRTFQQALDVPFQLYAPYFSPQSKYFGNWTSLKSDTSLPLCDTFDFIIPHYNESYDFYKWFFQKGIMNASMKSYELDFVNQNYNCIVDLFQSVYNGDKYLNDMSYAAYDEYNISMQWCYVTPIDVYVATDLPAVTNVRVSYDFCYGESWNIGESSLLLWALDAAAPSKDTLWTTNNNRTETPGCKWTSDHEMSAVELHVVLALLSTGPVGISDGIGMTNVTLLSRCMTEYSNILLKPSKPITAVDSSFLSTSVGGRYNKFYNDEKKDGNDDNDDENDEKSTSSSLSSYIYSTYGFSQLCWIFVSFQMRKKFPIRAYDFWPPILSKRRKNYAYTHVYKSNNDKYNNDTVSTPFILSSLSSSLSKRQVQTATQRRVATTNGISSSTLSRSSDLLLAYRQFDEGIGCQHGADAILSGCISIVMLDETQQYDHRYVIFETPASIPGSEYSPTITTVYKTVSCADDDSSIGTWFFLGELSKYVPLSDIRIKEVLCIHDKNNSKSGNETNYTKTDDYNFDAGEGANTINGINSNGDALSVLIEGDPGERVKLTALYSAPTTIRNDNNVDDDDNTNVVKQQYQFKVLQKTIIFPSIDDNTSNNSKISNNNNNDDKNSQLQQQAIIVFRPKTDAF